MSRQEEREVVTLLVVNAQSTGAVMSRQGKVKVGKLLVLNAQPVGTVTPRRGGEGKEAEDSERLL